jgi:CRP-like cAMP-binding protein
MQTDATSTTARSLADIKLFAGLPDEALKAIEAQCRWLSVEPKERALASGEQSTDVFFVVSGMVRVINYLDDGTEIRLGELSGGDIFGEMSAFDSKRRSAEVIGAERCVLGILPADAFRAVLLEHPRAALRLIEQLAEVIRAMNARVSELSTRTPRQRIYAELIRLAVPSAVGDGTWVIDNLPNHDEIASNSDAEKQEVAMAIGALARDGILERKHRRVVIRDHPRLRLMATM